MDMKCEIYNSLDTITNASTSTLSVRTTAAAATTTATPTKTTTPPPPPPAAYLPSLSTGSIVGITVGVAVAVVGAAGGIAAVAFPSIFTTVAAGFV